MASKIVPVERISQAEFQRSGSGYRECVDAFAFAAGLIGGRDLIEEFIVPRFGLCRLVGFLVVLGKLRCEG